MSDSGHTTRKPGRNQRWDVNAIRWNAVAGTDRKHTKGCEGCRYHDYYGDCIYILIEGHRRGVPMNPGGGCSKKSVSRTKSGKFILTDTQKQIAKTSKAWDFDTERAAQFYELGDSDTSIANKLHCRKQSILDWRKATGRVSNYIRRREGKL